MSDMAGMATPTIFVSHSHNDNSWCRSFVSALKSAGYDVWYDESSLQAGQSFIKKIEQEIETRHVFLIVLTPESWTSKWVRREIELVH
jgi:TIR domain-containing protein